ncbi:MAG: TolC family protein [bacterium]|nr:TolC family protein [bacterium]
MPATRRISLLAAVLLCAASAPSAAQSAMGSTADSLDLQHCLDAALSRNRELIQARERIEEVNGDRIVVHSRLMPNVQLTASYDALRTESHGQTQDNLASELLLQQRLFEFGPDAAAEISLRSDLRNAVFDYQDKVYQITSRVWEVFHIILLQNEQIALRRASKAAFDEVLARQQARYDKRLASEADKLSAELNVLEEELAINSLLRSQFRNRMDLMRLIGRPIGVELQLHGELAAFAVDESQAVRVAIARNVQIGLSEQLLDEQRRVVREIGWEYAPDLAVDANLEDGRRRAGISVDREGRTWGVNMETGLALSEQEQPGASDEATWSARVQARIPIFEGGARIGREALERARLRRLQEQLRDLRAGVELDVRQAYQSMLEEQEKLGLQEQRVVIARRRLEISQVLRDEGQGNEAQLEQVRDQFFSSQENLFKNQETYIGRQAQLRRLMGYLE